MDGTKVIFDADQKQLDIFKPGALTVANYRQRVTEAENYLLSLPQLEIPVEQHFSEGIYTREVTIPTGAVLTGAVHKKPCVVVVSKGDILVATEDGPQRVTGPASFVAPAGRKRIAVCLEECKWMTVHSYFGEPKDEAEMKQVIGCDNYEAYEAWLAQWDYLDFLREYGLTESYVLSVCMNTDDVVEIDIPVELKKSKIAGRGLFAGKDFEEGEIIGGARFEGKRTQLGRYVNHSPNPNIFPIIDGEDCIFTAKQAIKRGEEFTVNYRDTMRTQQ